MKSIVRHSSTRSFVIPARGRYRTPHSTRLPVLHDQQLEQILQTALAQLLQGRTLIGRDTLCNTTELENKALQQRAAIDATTRMMEDAITDNTAHVQYQHAYQQHFAQLEAQRREAVDELTATETEITRRQRLHADLATYRNALTELQQVAGDFNPAIYHVLCPASTSHQRAQDLRLRCRR